MIRMLMLAAGLITAVVLVVILRPGTGTVVGPGNLSVSARPAVRVTADRNHFRPVGSVRPRFLHNTYRAPSGLVVPGAGGTLRIPSLGVSAPVDVVGLDGTTMAIPNNPRRVGWLRTTATLEDLVGASVLSGHVSDERDVPGALARLGALRPGAVIVWIAHGVERRFVVSGIARYPRSQGVPASVFRTDGAHVLNLVTCTDRVATPGGGFHYRSNLVVTARAGPHSLR
ncbi:MAG: hypothetical protein JWR52_3319 [Marmoricola sp.]|nr:hypothetical protein [Marmoricola sp.]